MVIDAPSSFDDELKRLDGIAIVHRDPKKIKAFDFVRSHSSRNNAAGTRKALSSNVGCNCKTGRQKSRGRCRRLVRLSEGVIQKLHLRVQSRHGMGRDRLGKAGFESVRIVALDDDWSALRFRRVEFIRTMKRDAKRALTMTGRKRVANWIGSARLQHLRAKLNSVPQLRPLYERRSGRALTPVAHRQFPLQHRMTRPALWSGPGTRPSYSDFFCQRMSNDSPSIMIISARISSLACRLGSP